MDLERTHSSGSSKEAATQSQIFSEWGSALVDASANSPVDSTSTETESEEEDDYMADLALQMAHSMLEEDDNEVTKQNLESRKSCYMMSRSPQSILSGRSSKDQSPVSYDLLFAEALRQNREESKAVSMSAKTRNGSGAPVRDSVSVSYHSPLYGLQSRNNFSGFPSKESVNIHSAYATQRSWGQQTRQEDIKLATNSHRQAKQNPVPLPSWSRQAGSANSRPGTNGNRSVRSNNHSGAAAGSGMRAVFLDTNGSGGTGVFLPRRTGCNSDLRRKPPCSTVLLPSRIVHALNLQVEDIGCHPSIPTGPFCNNQREALLPTPGVPQGLNGSGRPSYCKFPQRNLHMEQYNGPARSLSSQIQSVSPEVMLPQDWTY